MEREGPLGLWVIFEEPRMFLQMRKANAGGFIIRKSDRGAVIQAPAFKAVEAVMDV